MGESIDLRAQKRYSGQVEVETAIVLPAVVFLVLGLIQLGLIHQARIMAKYAAYHAVRTGAMRNANKTKMQYAATAAVLPILSRPAHWILDASFDTNKQSYEMIDKIKSDADWAKKWLLFQTTALKMPDVLPPLDWVEVEICGPLKNSAHSYKPKGSSQRFIAFDDPTSAGSADATKLRIEVTLNYRMPIPFANWVIFRMFSGQRIMQELRLEKMDRTDQLIYDAVEKQGTEAIQAYDLARVKSEVFKSQKDWFQKYIIPATFGHYILPLRAHYAMKLHSDVKLDDLPDENKCYAGGKES